MREALCVVWMSGSQDLWRHHVCFHLLCEVNQFGHVQTLEVDIVQYKHNALTVVFSDSQRVYMQDFAPPCVWVYTQVAA